MSLTTMTDHVQTAYSVAPYGPWQGFAAELDPCLTKVNCGPSSLTQSQETEGGRVVTLKNTASDGTVPVSYSDVMLWNHSFNE